MKEGEDLMLSEKRIQELRDAGRRIRKRGLKLAIEKEKYYSAVIDKAQKEMRRGKKHDDEK